MKSRRRLAIHRMIRSWRHFWLGRWRLLQPIRWRLLPIAVLMPLFLTFVVVLASTRIGWLENGSNRYMVFPGETLEEIAAKHDVPATLLVQVNRLSDPQNLRFGQTLLIPESSNGPYMVVPEQGRQGPVIFPSQIEFSLDAEANHNPKAINTPVPAEHYYHVQYGDSLLGIATYFGLPVSIVREANQLTEDSVIHVNDRLIIPDRTVHEVPGKGAFVWPISSQAVIRGYFYGHKAIDILMPIGSPVVAAGDGVVEMAGWHAYGYGNVIMIDHGEGTKTLYAHLNSIGVVNGQEVAQGEKIAETGHTGYSTHPHLHLELYIEGQAVYPCLFLTGGCD